MREMARLDRPGPTRRRRVPRVRRGTRRRGRRAATGSARALQPAAARLRGEAACLSKRRGFGRATAASQPSLSPRYASRGESSPSSSRPPQPTRGWRGRDRRYRHRHRAPPAASPGSRDGGATAGLLRLAKIRLPPMTMKDERAHSWFWIDNVKRENRIIVSSLFFRILEGEWQCINVFVRLFCDANDRTSLAFRPICHACFDIAMQRV